MADFPALALTELLAGMTRRKTQGQRLVGLTCTPLAGGGHDLLYHLDHELTLETLRLTVDAMSPLPSLTPVYSAAFLAENEIQDLFGLRFQGLTPDYQGRLYLEPTSKELPRPLPAPPAPADEQRAETVATTSATRPSATARGSLIPFGPQHPVLPEPLQLRLRVEDEIVVEALPTLGYVHRGLERLAASRDLHQMVQVVERVCGICSAIHAQCYCQSLEGLLGVEPTDRATYLRVAWGELHRLHSHLLWLGLFADALGFESLFMQFWRVRERVMDINEATAGNRVIISVNIPGGVRRDLNPEQIAMIRSELDVVEGALRKIGPVLLDDYTTRRRTEGKGVLTRGQALELGAAGPTLRASGVAQDMRQQGYAAYGRLEFEPVVETAGDSLARCRVRYRECLQSIGLVRQALTKLPAGELAAPYKGRPTGEIVTRVEQPRGECLYYLKANGTKHLDRLRIRTPTFANIPALAAMLPGVELADVPVITLSIDPCMSCTER